MRICLQLFINHLHHSRVKNKIVTFEEVRDKIVDIRGQQVIPDFVVADFYGVETKRINEAVKNNPAKFPSGYLIELDNQESKSLRSKISTLESDGGRGKYSKHNYKVFTERGIYMLATILKGKKATDTTIVIIDTFAQLRELSRNIGELSNTSDANKQKKLIQKSGEIMEDLFGNSLSTSETETEIELNFAVLKLKHTIKRKKGDDD